MGSANIRWKALKELNKSDDSRRASPQKVACRSGPGTRFGSHPVPFSLPTSICRNLGERYGRAEEGRGAHGSSGTGKGATGGMGTWQRLHVRKQGARGPTAVADSSR